MRRENTIAHSLFPFAAVVVLVISSQSTGADWMVIGARQRAMGGAGVATADHTSAIYWNPAALGADTSWGSRIDIDGSIELAPGTLSELDGLIEDIQRLQDEFDTIEAMQANLDDPNAGTPDDMVGVLRLMLVELIDLNRHDLGMFVDVSGGVRAHVGRIAFSVSGTAHVDAGLVADLGALALSQAGAGASTAFDRMVAALDDENNPSPTDWWMTEDFLVDGTPEEQFAETLEPIFAADPSISAAEADTMAEALVYFSGSDDPYGFTTNGTAGADISDPEVQEMLRMICEATVAGTDVVLDNATGIVARGVLLEEYALAASMPLLGNQLSIGATAKMMAGTGYEGSASYDRSSTAQTAGEVVEDLWDQIDANGTVETNQLGLDVGILWRPSKYLSVGVTGKNINSPSFDLPLSDDPFVLRPQWRAGVAVRPVPFITCALDIDVTENYSQIAGDYGTRFYALGVEVSLLKILRLRAGTYGNLLIEESLPAYTAGFGVRIGSLFSLDLAANLNGDPQAISDMMSGDADMDLSAMPEAAGVSLSFQLNTRF